MDRAVALSSYSSTPFVVESSAFTKCSRPIPPGNCYASRRDHVSIPKLEPFSRSKIDRAFKDPPLIQKSENQIADYCLTVEGDESYSCWQAYFELKDLQKEAGKEEIERLILETGGVKSLIGCVHGIASIHKSKKESSSSNPVKVEKKGGGTVASSCPVPDGLPKAREEVEEEEKARMPDSAFTRLLRAKGNTTHPAWFSPA